MDTILEFSQALRAKAISPVELVADCLDRVEKLNPALNAFVTVTAERALEQARRAEKEILNGQWRGALHGIPIGLKDLIDTSAIPTTSASELHKHRIPRQDAVVVRKLFDAGAILLGKQNLHEFAYGASSMISCFGPVRNAWDRAQIAGGSSGGSAAAVAAGLGLGAIGTDTAGSIREPAALCGVVGLKPTYGRVSARGVFPLSESLDHVGPITRTVADAALLFRTIAEATGNEGNAATGGFGTKGKQPLPELRVGVPRACFFAELEADVSEAVEQALRVLEELGAEVREIQLTPDTDRTLQAGEAFAVHARSVAATPELYQAETLRRIKTGEHITQDELAQRRVKLEAEREKIREVFHAIDVIVTSTTPVSAPAIADLEQNPDQLRPRELLLLRNTRPFNVWGIPAISVPCGFTPRGLPIGLQIAGPPGHDELVLRVAHAYEQASEWHKRRPALSTR